jgi:hypothetical protein
MRNPKNLKSAEIWAHTLNAHSWQGHIEETYTTGEIKTRRGEFPYMYRGHGLKTRLQEARTKVPNESILIHFLDVPADE